MGHGFFSVIGPREPEFARDLPQRPREIELMAHHAVRVQFGRAARAKQRASHRN